jgi:hypothetical protein
MKWQKQGCIFSPPENLGWMQSHAALPVVEDRHHRHRVYFSGRDEQGRARIGFFDFDITRPHEIIDVSQHPVAELGSLGSFDDNGMTVSWLVNHAGQQYLYYSGWNLGVTVPFYFFVGVLKSNGRAFQRVSDAPILPRHPVDPYLTASPCVLVEDATWRMWYVSCTGWNIVDGQIRHHYHIKYAESSDGIHWQRDGRVCIDFKSADEYAISRPCVVRDPDMYRMWYSYRGASYRIGYAESPDGLVWQRKDKEAGIDVSAEGWDSEMIAYPYVFDHKGRRYMLYNGNGYGKTGIGLAVIVNAE